MALCPCKKSVFPINGNWFPINGNWMGNHFPLMGNDFPLMGNKIDFPLMENHIPVHPLPTLSLGRVWIGVYPYGAPFVTSIILLYYIYNYCYNTVDILHLSTELQAYNSVVVSSTNYRSCYLYRLVKPIWPIYCRTHNVCVCLHIAYIVCGSASLYFFSVLWRCQRRLQSLT